MIKFEHGGQVHRWKESYPNLLDFSANINPLGLAESIKSALENRLEEIVHYPEPYSVTLRAKIAEHYQIPVSSLFVGNGAAEILYLLARILKPKKALITAPTFGEYRRSLHGLGSIVEEVALGKDFSFPFDTICQKISQTDIAYFGNPNNPAGKLVLTEEWEPILKEAQKANTFLVIDESFLDFLPEGGKKQSAFSFIRQKYKNLLVLRSLTKFYALPGLRLGFCSASEEVVCEMEGSSDGWNVNRLAQIAGLIGLDDACYQEETRNSLPLWQNSMIQELASWEEVRFFEPTVNFVLCCLKEDKVSVKDLSEEALKQGLLIRDAGNFSTLDRKWFRLAIRTAEENKRAVAILKNAYHICYCRNS